MSESTPRLTIEELAAQADVPVRTVRYYIAEGLLPGPGSRGKGAAYGAEHLIRLRLIRRLAARRVPLGEIRDLLTRLPADEAHAVLREEARRADELESSAGAPSPKAYISALLGQAGGSQQPPATYQPLRAVRPAQPKSALAMRSSRSIGAAPTTPEETWRRWTLAPGIELQVRGDIVSDQEEVIERLIRAAHSALNPPFREES
jgi:DNA-binding transcriptional MerR regulator